MLTRKLLLTTGLGLMLLAGCTNNASTTSSTTTGGTTGTTAASPGATGGGDLTIAVIPKGTTHSYWKSVQAGAEKAGQEMGAKIQWKGPLKEDDRAGQIQVVQQFTADNVSAIVLAPLDDVALATPVTAAMNKKIPVVIIDSALKGTAGKDWVSLVATDNKKAGGMGGEQLAKVLGGKGKVVLLRYAEGSASTMDREAGFLEALKKYPGITVISDKNYGGATQSEAQTKAMQMVDVLKQADGVFCPNESTSLGMLQALKQNNLAGKIKFVGFDSAPGEIDAVKSGDMVGVVAQNPTKMGYEGVKAAIAAIKKQPVEGAIDTGAVVITKDNMDSPEVKELLAAH